MKHVRTIGLAVTAMIGVATIAIACGETERVSLSTYDRWCEEYEERLDGIDVEDEASIEQLRDLKDDMKGVNPPEELDEHHSLTLDALEFSIRFLEGDAGPLSKAVDEMEELAETLVDAADDIPNYIIEEVPNCSSAYDW